MQPALLQGQVVTLRVPARTAPSSGVSLAMLGADQPVPGSTGLNQRGRYRYQAFSLCHPSGISAARVYRQTAGRGGTGLVHRPACKALRRVWRSGSRCRSKPCLLDTFPVSGPHLGPFALIRRRVARTMAPNCSAASGRHGKKPDQYPVIYTDFLRLVEKLWAFLGKPAGAGSGNRTRIASLEGWCFTTKLYPRTPRPCAAPYAAAARPGQSAAPCKRPPNLAVRRPLSCWLG